jgi:hypothetical protein
MTSEIKGSAANNRYIYLSLAVLMQREFFVYSHHQSIKGIFMNRYLFTALFALLSAGAQADRFRPDVDVNVPAEVFSSGGQRAQPCNQCCIYQDQNYSEGAVVKADGVLLQCQRDERTISTNPLVWRRVKG